MARRSRSFVVAAILCALGSSLIPGPAFADHVDSLLEKSRAAEHQGHLDAAIRLAQAAIVADPTRASSYTALGGVYARSDQAEFARFYFGEALAIDPQDADAQAALARAESADQTGPAAAARSLDKGPSGN
jgi:tetratricopeptide (TPR) repeat protein